MTQNVSATSVTTTHNDARSRPRLLIMTPNRPGTLVTSRYRETRLCPLGLVSVCHSTDGRQGEKMGGFLPWRAAAVAVGISLASTGCATAIRGSTQSILVASEPAGADCTLSREDQQLGKVTTPGQITISRNPHLARIVCTKAGYQDNIVLVYAKGASPSFIPFPGPVALLFGASALVDNRTGAAYRYEPSVMVWLVPAGSPAASSPSAFDGEYRGSVQAPSGTVWQVDIRMADGDGIGTTRQGACSSPGQMKLTADSLGQISGEIDYLDSNTCKPSEVTASGRVAGNRLQFVLPPSTKVLSIEKVQTTR